jgi:hypothetical protein
VHEKKLPSRMKIADAGAVAVLWLLPGEFFFIAFFVSFFKSSISL